MGAATAVAHLHHPTPKASDLRCGISSSWELLGGCPRCLHSALHTGNFSGPWTNRQTLPRIDELGKHEHAAAASTFVPTLFGAGALTGEVTSPVLFRQRKMKHGQLVALTRPWFRAEKHFLQQAPAVLGWHRPDLFSPTFPNEAPKTAGDEPLRDSRAADEVGSPRAAQNWKAMVQNLSTHHKAYYGTGRHTRIIAPLVGADRSGLNGDGTRAGISPRAPCTFPKDQTREAMAFWGGPSYQRACDGWLADFKRSTLQLPCVSPAGKHTNCWDVTSSLNLQVTGEPSREGAQHVLVQVEEYAKIFADDLAGAHGRSQKTLWLTEVAVASSDLGEILPFVEYLMDPVEGLRNRERFWYVEVVSWKHAHSINSKEHPTNPPPSVAGSSVAKKREEGLWVSSLFDAFGDLTPLGAAFFGACPRGLAVPRAAAASAAVSAAASAGGTPSTVAQEQPPPPLTPAPKPAAALPLQCGVATGFFAGCRSCALAALQTGRLSRWYNWGMAPFGFLDPKTPRKLRTEMHARFMPMHWGPKMLQPGEAPSKPMNMPGWHLSLLRSNAAEFSFFNEPDAYGPAYWAEAVEWATTSLGLGAIDSFGRKRRIVSPAMAYFARPDANASHSCVGVDPRLGKPAGGYYCKGWLHAFKQAALKLRCTTFGGVVTNCWDVIDVISMHSYANSVADILHNLREYGDVFAEDFAGANGRSKKVLWLSEIAMGASELDEILPFVDGLMAALNDRVAFGFVELVAWLHDMSLAPFTINTTVPRPNQRWTSALFGPYGELSPIGRRFFAACPPAPPLPMRDGVGPPIPTAEPLKKTGGWFALG